MSATGRALTKRHAYDAYSTPPWCTDAIAREIVWGTKPRIMEPCIGEGMISSLLILRGITPSIQWCEIQKGRDFFELSNAELRYDFIITNPPFGLAQEFIEKSLTLANCVVMLLRLNFLASSKRKEFWQKHRPTAVHVLTKRPSFTGKGTDACDYAWFVWDATGRQKVGFHWL